MSGADFKRAVSISPCADYAPENVYAALSSALCAMGGLDWVRPGMRVAVKVNLLTLLRPDTAAVTHPAGVDALCRLLNERGATAVIGDSPGGPFLPAYVTSVYRASGLLAIVREGVALNADFGQKEADFPAAVKAKKFAYTSWLDHADAIIDFCKLKTHGMMGMTAAVKNLFGAVPGTIKPEYHFRYADPVAFSDMLVDIAEYFKPVLSIADAVTAMEGNGPSMGQPRHVGAILASFSPYALDLACARLIGMPFEGVPTLARAVERGLCTGDFRELDIYGDLESLRVPDFKKIERYNRVEFTNELFGLTGNLKGAILKKALCSKPAVEVEQCVGCKKCAEICPAKAIMMKKSRSAPKGAPRIDGKACIRCFCCQEFCPAGAMVVRRPLMARLLNRAKEHPETPRSAS